MLFWIIMAGNKYNLAFRERIVKDHKKGVKQKSQRNTPLTSQLYVE